MDLIENTYFCKKKHKDISQEAICRVNIPFKSSVKNTQADVPMFYLNNLLEICITAYLVKYHKGHLIFYICICSDNSPLQNDRNETLSSFAPLHLPNYSKFLCTTISDVYI